MDTVNLLLDCETHLMRARDLARDAVAALPPTRATRAQQLVDQIEHCMAWCQRVNLSEANR